MRVNISQNNIMSIDFDTVDQVIDFIKKFNKDQDTITINPCPWTGPFETIPQEPWYHDIKIGDTVPDPNIVYCKNRTYTTSNTITE